MREKLDKLETVLLYFICYSFVGWSYELVLWIFEEHNVMNRGFLFGPWLPIYGFGGLLLYKTLYVYSQKPLLVGEKQRNIKPVIICLLVSVIAAGVELVSTYILDLAHVDWSALWEYSDYAINFDNRIALLPALKFGILACIIMYGAQKEIDEFVNDKTKHIVHIALIALFAIDLAVHLMIGSNYTDVPLFYL